MRNEKPLEYSIPTVLFNEILKTRTEGQKKENPYTYVMNVINEQYGLLGKVTHLFID